MSDGNAGNVDDDVRGERWSRISAQLKSTPLGADADDVIDELCDGLPDLLAGAPENAPSPAAIASAMLDATAKASSTLSLRDALMGVVHLVWALESELWPQDGGHRARVAGLVEALAAATRDSGHDAFLGPEALHALALAAERSALALAEVRASVLRLTRADSRYLLMRAAKVVGRLECMGLSIGGVSQLHEFLDAEDPAAQAEANLQLGIVNLFNALKAPDVGALREGMREAERSFIRAEASEEGRRDAALLLQLTRAVLAALPEGAQGRTSDRAAWANDVARAAESLRTVLVDPEAIHRRAYATASDQALEYRLWLIADSLAQLASSVSQADDWTNLDDALAGFAGACALIADRRTDDGLPEALRMVEATVIVPSLGALIEESIGRRRLRRVADHYAATGGQERIADVLQRLYHAAVEQAPLSSGVSDGESPYRAAPALTPDELRHVATLSAHQLATVLRVSPAMRPLLIESGYEVQLAAAGAARLMPAADVTMYGGDPAVDVAARSLLEPLWARVGGRLSLEQWHRVRETVVFLISATRDLRDDRPAFLLRAEDGGLGQGAGEDHLQDYLHERIRTRFGRGVEWERSRVAGGRTDLGVRFAECDIPIEVKAEYRDVSPAHIRSHYLAQTDEYAAVRDEMSALMILDLRAGNATPSDGGKTTGVAVSPEAAPPPSVERPRSNARRRVGTGTGSTEPAERFSLYSLRESFWVDGLAPDPQLPDAAPKAVVVGLVPGNRPKPSSTSTYSRRPRSRRLQGDSD